jgi:uncharacterized protein (TIGR02453 family)
MIRKTTLDFLRNLARNNDREWFAAHKDQYQLALANASEFFDEVIAKLNAHDRIETPSAKQALYRIYRDVRFSKDSTPYNPRFAGHFSRTRPMLRGGYYLWIKPGESRLGCGFVYPNPDDLKRIRLDILDNYKRWNRLLRSKGLQSSFGDMQGDQVASAPRGFPREHPAIDLLRYKQFWFERSFSDREVLAKGFIDEVNRTYKSIRPFFDYMSEMLTTDSTGKFVV